MSINRDDFFRDKFRTGNDALTGVVFYYIALPDTLWFLAQVADALLALTIADNWEKGGTVEIDETTDKASEALMSFKSMVGAIFPVAWATVPDGFLLCDGSSYLRVDYPSLYEVLPAWLISDADNFTVPDLRGRVVVGPGSGITEGDSAGETTHTLTTGEIPSHIHTTGNSLLLGTSAPPPLDALGPNPFPAFTGSAGGDGPHNNMQPYLSIQYVIAAR